MQVILLEKKLKILKALRMQIQVQAHTKWHFNKLRIKVDTWVEKCKTRQNKRSKITYINILQNYVQWQDNPRNTVFRKKRKTNKTK
jgi:hypothetical protein